MATDRPTTGSVDSHASTESLNPRRWKILAVLVVIGKLLLDRGYELAGGTLVAFPGLMLLLIAYVMLVLP